MPALVTRKRDRPFRNRQVAGDGELGELDLGLGAVNSSAPAADGPRTTRTRIAAMTRTPVAATSTVMRSKTLDESFT